ncbi:MAG: phosphoribosyltransferase family protein [Candidatus Asgardarchaeia archaeon]
MKEFRNGGELRKLSVLVLKLVRRYKKLREISKDLGKPIFDISKYTSMRVLPSLETAKKIVEIYDPEKIIKDEISKRCFKNEYGLFNNQMLVSDILSLEIIAEIVFQKFKGNKVTKVMTAEVDGIPLATLVANKFGVDLVIAKKKREVGVTEFYEETVLFGTSGVSYTLYVPKTSLKKLDHVIIVDDLIRYGETQNALIKILKRAEAKLVGIFVPIIIGEYWKENLKEYSDKLNYLVNLS